MNLRYRLALWLFIDQEGMESSEDFSEDNSDCEEHFRRADAIIKDVILGIG